MSSKLKVRFLTAIWGRRYIEEFCQVSLPSYLAPGNLPALAAECAVEVVILTAADSLDHFADQAAFQRLGGICPVRFVLIDDLVTKGNYGVTLTLAYARGIAESGPDQTETTFVFMNSDFVLADGSLANLVRRMQDGQRCVLAASLRVAAEAVLPHLTAAVDTEASVLRMPPRQMVRLALGNLHPTVIAKTMNQTFLTSRTHNQLYWSVDATTLLGRHFLIFMLAIRPEVPIDVIDSYCDYGFVPSLVPSGRITIVDDSDEFFMMELQATAQEGDFLRAGTTTAGVIADELAFWTTAEHRRAAETEVVFHAADRPERLPAESAAFAACYREIVALMDVPPVRHAGHYYWVSGLRAWQQLREAERRTNLPLPPEAAELGPPEPHRRHRRRSGLLDRLWPQPARFVDMPVWHHRWLDAQLFRAGWLDRASRTPQARILLVCTPGSDLPDTLAGRFRLDVETGLRRFVRRRALAEARSEPRPSYDEILVHVSRVNVRETRAVLEAAEPLLGPAGTLTVFIDHPEGEFDPSNFTAELGSYAIDLLPSDWLGFNVDGQFVGGRRKRALRVAGAKLLRHVAPLRAARLPIAAVAAGGWLALAGLTALNNQVQHRAAARRVDYCSSALLTIRRRG